MPTYVYKFTDTGETIEVQQAFADPTLTEYAHPSDGVVRSVKKVFQPVGVTFRGNGFYKTDSRSGSSSGLLRRLVRRSDGLLRFVRVGVADEIGQRFVVEASGLVGSSGTSTRRAPRRRRARRARRRGSSGRQRGSGSRSHGASTNSP